MVKEVSKSVFLAVINSRVYYPGKQAKFIKVREQSKPQPKALVFWKIGGHRVGEVADLAYVSWPLSAIRTAMEAAERESPDGCELGGVIHGLMLLGSKSEIDQPRLNHLGEGV